MMANISPKEAYEKIGEFIIIDARTPEEFAGGHIAGAQNINVSLQSFGSEIAKLDKSKKYLVYCNAGNRSFYASTIMSNAGFGDVYNMQGGIFEWQREGLPVEKIV